MSNPDIAQDLHWRGYQGLGTPGVAARRGTRHGGARPPAGRLLALPYARQQVTFGIRRRRTPLRFVPPRWSLPRKVHRVVQKRADLNGLTHSIQQQVPSTFGAPGDMQRPGIRVNLRPPSSCRRIFFQRLNGEANQRQVFEILRLAETLERERKRLDHLLFGAWREANDGYYFAVRSAILARAPRSK